MVQVHAVSWVINLVTRYYWLSYHVSKLAELFFWWLLEANSSVSCRWYLCAWTTAMHHSPVCPALFLTDCSLCLMLPHAWFTHPGSTITCLRCWMIYTGCEFLSGLSSSSPCSFTDVCVAQCHLTLLRCVLDMPARQCHSKWGMKSGK